MGKHAKQNLDLIFTGDGADEIFAGYSNRYRAQKLRFFSYFPKKIFNLSMKGYNFIPFSRLRVLLAYLEQSNSLEDRYIRNLFDAIYDREKIKAVPFQPENVKSYIKSTFKEKLDIVNQFTYWDLKFQLPNLYNVKADRAINAASLTGRIPLLDTNIVSWSLTIPSELKLKGTIEKYILRLAIKDFVPSEVLKRKKLGFGTPINFWLNSALKDISKDCLENLSKRKNLIKTEYVKKIIKNRIKKIYEFRTWNLMMFELWYETFIENNGVKPITF
jgi:asparagine synthase (glutamine-hydrolysing)